MDTVTTIIGVIVIIAILFPLAYIQYKAKKTKQKMLKALSDYAATGGCNISQYDTWLNHAIAIDADKKHVFYMQVKPVEHFLSVDLNEAADCKITGNKDTGNIEQLALLFTFKNGTPPKSLSFFDDAASMQLNEELILAKKWMDICHRHMA